MACAVHGVPRGILRLAQFFTSRYARSPEVADIATRVAGDGQTKSFELIFGQRDDRLPLDGRGASAAARC